jgi:hypothetical protein
VPPPPLPIGFGFGVKPRPPFGANDSVCWVSDFFDNDDDTRDLLLALAFSYFLQFAAAAATCLGFISPNSL